MSRWSRGEKPGLLNTERVEVLELVTSELSRLFEPEAAKRWLTGTNPHLGDRRPIDVICVGRPEELLAALRAERAGSPA